MRTVLIKGYYGYNNLGDDFLLYSILDTLNSIGTFNVIVVSAGDEYEDLFYKFSNLSCKIFPLSKWKKFTKIMCIAQCDYWIIGGGGLFPSEEKANIPNLKKEISIAQRFGKKVCIYGIDINSIDKKENMKAWFEISKLVSFIVCRNDKTRRMLGAIGCRNVIRTADITFGLETEKDLNKNSGAEVKNKIGIGDKKFVLWSIPMLWSSDDMRINHNQSRYWKLIETLQMVANSKELCKYTNVFLPFFYEKDIGLYRDLVKGINGNYLLLEEKYGLSYEEKRVLFKEAEFCICMRFHAAMFSLFYKRPALYISYSDKTSDVIKECGLRSALCEYGFSNSENFYREFDLDYNDVISKIRKILSGGGGGVRKCMSCL